MEQYWQQIWIAWEWGKAILATLMLTGLGMSAIIGAAYAFFKFFGEKWLSQKFAERLESYKAEQTRELERLRHKINGVFDRTKRLHDKEFEVLPDIWAKLVDARDWAGSYMAAFKQYADIGRMNDADLDEFLATTKFSEGQKREVKNASDKQNAYVNTLERYRHADAMDRLREANVSLSKHGIFVLPEVREDMKKMIDLIHSAIVEHQINDDHDVRPRMREEAAKLKTEGEPLFKKIERAVIDRLWESTMTEV
ncbi:hypothetical protein [Rhizobium binae]|uniref:hypothetical protein n=1 Tax=Rhizobium binae TaxID=1138190 RepID=UPI001C830A45|nr:hypothetical protein [Rhizobium binae]MBX4940788.1 hypothetical protein [Rhizobium binae]MBX4947318.1 hypothetical protein [Rhizobium binae]MBX4983211.1 hypothetical protein [Rhizobium binae]